MDYKKVEPNKANNIDLNLDGNTYFNSSYKH